ncbi:MAG: hypothetical protein RLN88_08120 [Ekhidna sp.]|uniref:hypothetical protein n=1 Tax=Ekhidna sp. TaxID=2608089 RepID=UPI0032EE02E3
MSEKYKLGNNEGLYFVTSTVVHWIDLFTRKELRHIITSSLKHCQKEKGLQTRVANARQQGGDPLRGVASVNWTSVALSGLNPTATFKNVITNSTLASAFELRADGRSNNIFIGKSAGDIGRSVAVSLGANGAFSGIASIGRYGVNSSNTMSNYLFNAGFSPGSKAFVRNAQIGAASHFASTTGFVSAGVYFSTNIFD